ncbi:MAG: phosphotransferase [Dehalococcoidia bacterium]
MVDESEILATLGYAPDVPATWESIGDSPWSPVTLTIGGESPRELLIRESADIDEAQNHAAVFEALANAGYQYVPRLVAIVGNATIEESPAGTTAMQLVPPPGSAEAVMAALAAWHALPLKEGLDWGRAPEDLFPVSEIPLHRLGFAAAEREPALAPLQEARDYLVASPFGFAHRNAVAANVLLAPGNAWLTDFSAAGNGPQYFDVAAFLLTSGIEAPGRRALAAAYARHRSVSPDASADQVDLLGILWGIGWLLELPRRLITNLGDDATTDSLKLASTRVERGIRQPAGDSSVAAAIRAALWPPR